MRAVVIETPRKFGIAEIPDPAPGPGEVLIAPRAVGICGTDLHIIDGHFAPAPYPLVPGHEFAGEVVDIGRDVDGLTPGDRVAVDPSLFCGRCVYCKRQRGNLCQNWGAIGDTVNGAFADLVPVSAGNAYRIPDDLSWEAAALIEPLSCVVHGLRRLRLPPGSELLIVGAGTIGLLLLQAAKVSGAAEVHVLEPDSARRQMALSLGARSAAGTLADLMAGRAVGFDFAVEATGVPAAAADALAALCRGGTLLIFGVAPETATVKLSQFRVYNDEITVLGSMAVLSTFEPALRMMANGAIAADKMVTHRYPLSQFADAVEAVRSRAGLKVQVANSGR